jgi:adenylate kinase family enzyme
MQRVMILGPPGSGKSTLARALATRLGVPVFHLDQAFWRPGWVEAPPDAFRAEVEHIAALPGWVVDGNYTATLAPRLRAADTLVLLDVPRWLSLLRILRRVARDRGRVRADMAPGCPERLDWPFLVYAWRWNGRSRARWRAIAAMFPGRVERLRGARAIGRFLVNVEPNRS